MKLFLPLSLLLMQTPLLAQNDIFDKGVDKGVIDVALRNRIKFYNLVPLPAVAPHPNRSLVELGKQLFSDTILSGNHRVSCLSCHTKEGASSDALPMSRSEDNRGILRRNTPSLFNAGVANKSFMFLDGRVHFDSNKKVFTTPEAALNGENPSAKHITAVMSSSLAAQALFPLVAHDEMLGRKGENEIADAKNNLEAWERIVMRLKNSHYSKLLQQAYPETPLQAINIGHVAEAIAAFEREKFQAMNSPFQRYLKGDNGAMSGDQKRGFFIFMGSGKCINCHNGGDLGDNKSFASVSAPQWGAAPLKLDFGRAEVTRNKGQNFFFRVPGLINVAITAPYMHNGSFQTLREVIKHYDHLSGSLNDFEVSSERQSKIPVEVGVEKNPAMLDDIWLSSQTPNTPKLKNRLLLTKPEKDFLEIFLKEALTDPGWRN